MPPKSKAPSRNPSSTTIETSTVSAVSKDKEKTPSNAAGAKGTMPPPPDPPAPKALLEAELNALKECLRNVTIKTDQILRFHIDSRRLGIDRFAPNPPRSLVSELTYEAGAYDQLCDSLESQISRAIAVLQRDLSREETRVREEEARKAAAAKLAESKQQKDVEMAPPSSSGDRKIQFSPSAHGPQLSQFRRPSKIQLSTLHRNQLPLKLDLSSVRMNVLDEASMGLTGLASPVTLAPKSARPTGPGEIPPDLFAALAATSGQGHSVEIDLTMENPVAPGLTIDNTLGSSADKPIELDLDDLFGEKPPDGQANAGAVSALFHETTTGSSLNLGGGSQAGSGQENMDMNILSALATEENRRATEDLFASIQAGGVNPGDGQSPTSMLTNIASSTHDVENQDLSNSSASTSMIQNSADGFDMTQLNMPMEDMQANLSSFFDQSNPEHMEMMQQFLTMHAGAANENGGGGTTSNSSNILDSQ